jgi:hypothetical protein
VINDQLPKSSYPSAVTELILVCYLAVAFGVPETILVFAIAKSSSAKAEAIEEKKASLLRNDEAEDEEFIDEQGHNTQTQRGKDGDSPVELDEEERIDHSMSIVMNKMRRKKSEKIPFIIDMSCLVIIVIIVITSTTLIIVGP